MAGFDMLEALLRCQTVEELYDSTSRLVKNLGYEHFIYGVQVNVSLTRPYQFVLSGYPKEWRGHYVEQGYQEIDPTVEHCIRDRRVIPILWDRKAFGTRKAAKMLGEARECGLASGVSFAVHGGHGEAAMLSLATARDSRDAKRDVVGKLGEAQLLACYLHEAVQRVVLSKEAVPLAKVVLTGREKECLLWAAEGKTTWEISSILHTSERTVVFHLQNASRKMGVSNRCHAVARALSLGLVRP